jgi:hypothetical protein
MLQSVGSIDLLPQAKEAVPNVYSVVSPASDRQSTLAISDNALWSISDYTMYSEAIPISGSGTYTIDMQFNPASPLAIPDPNGVYGEVLVQIVDGQSVGTVRAVRALDVISNIRRYTFDTPLTLLPNFGDTVRIYVKTLQGGKYWNLLSGINTQITSGHINALVSDPVDVLVRLDGTKPMTGALSLGNNRITGIANPVAVQDAVNLQTLTSSISNELNSFQHNTSQGLQGGAAAERYHLNNAEHSVLLDWIANGIPSDKLPSSSTATSGIVRLATTAQHADGISGLVALTPSGLSSAISSPSTNSLQLAISSKVRELSPLSQTGTGEPTISTPIYPSLYIDITTPSAPVSYAYNVPNSTWYRIASTGSSGLPISGSELTVTGLSTLAGINASGPTLVSNTLDVSGVASLLGNTIFGTNNNNTTLIRSTPTFNTDVTINGSASYPIKIGSRSTATNIGIGQGALGLSHPLANVSTGTNNVFIGKGSGGLVTSASNNVSVGSGSGTSIVSGNNNTFVGYISGGSVSGESNTSVGAFSLPLATSTGNTAVGSYALNATTTGTNVAVGYNSGRYLNIGSGNTSVGTGALATSTDGNYNTAIGHSALTLFNNNNTSGPCTAVGYGALASATTGGSNTAIGYNALTSAVSTTKTVAIGNSALSTYTGTGDIVFVGSMYTGTIIPNTARRSVVIGTDISSNTNATGYNISIGNQSGVSGSRNIAIGTYARGECDSTASNNVVIGDFASYANTGVSYTVAVGGYCQANATNSIAVGYGSAVNLLADYSVSIGHVATIHGANNIAIGRSSGVDSNNTVPSTGNIAIGALSNSVGTNSIVIGMGSRVTATNAILIGPNTSVGVANSVTLGSSSHTSYNMYTAQWTNISDIRDKIEINTLDTGLSLINKLRPVKFKWNLRDGARVGDEDSGFIAQEVLATVGTTTNSYLRLVNTDNPEQLRLSTTYLIPVLVNAVNELTAELEILKREIRKE